MRTPIEVAYKALGEDYTHPASAVTLTDYVCVRCQNRASQGTLSTPLLKVISNKFTDWELLAETSGEASLCTPCAWSYSILDNRLRRILISRGKVFPLESVKVSRALLFLEEMENPFSIVVPVSGKKHVLPYAKWGTLSYDDGEVKWNEQLAKDIAAIHFLKKSGLSESALKSRQHYYPPSIDPLLFFAAWEQFENMESYLLNLYLVFSRLLDDNTLKQAFKRWNQ